MIHIIKGAEPQSLKDCRKTPGAVFQDVDKSDLRNSLLREQGFLCAYCMTRIHNDENTKIEHYEARNPENEMVYANLLAVCKGNETLRGSEGKVDPQRFTCDTKKGNNSLCIDPQNRHHMETIYYDYQGKIFSTEKTFQKDLNDTLNLNDPYGYLIPNRKAVIAALRKELSKLKPGQSAESLLRKWQNKYSDMNSNGEYQDYIGVIWWFIQRHIKKYN